MQDQLKALYDHLRYLYLGNRFFAGLGGIVVFSAVGFYWEPFFYLAILGMVVLFGALLYDTYRLFTVAGHITASRKTPKVFSLSDEMPVRVQLSNTG